MKLTLTLDIEQLGILMSGFEATWSLAKKRDRETIANEVANAAANWDFERDASGFQYEIVKSVPVYLQLLEAWNSLGLNAADAGTVWVAETEQQFGDALATALLKLNSDAPALCEPWAFQLAPAERAALKQLREACRQIVEPWRKLCDRAKGENRELTSKERRRCQAYAGARNRLEEGFFMEIARLQDETNRAACLAAAAGRKEVACV